MSDQAAQARESTAHETCPEHGDGCGVCAGCGHFTCDCICAFLRDEWPTHHANPERSDA